MKADYYNNYRLKFIHLFTCFYLISMLRETHVLDHIGADTRMFGVPFLFT